MITFEELQLIKEIVTLQVVCYTTNYFKDYYKMKAVDLNKLQELDADPKAIQQINFTINLNRTNNVNENATVFFIIEEAKETVLDFLQGTVELL